MTPGETGLDDWRSALEGRYLSALRLPEVTRALRALSSVYVERRDRLARGAALDGGGKRAAFALFYAPLHFSVVSAVLQALPPATGPITTVVDLGCGTGAGGAAWALHLGRRPRVAGIDRHHWAVVEAEWTYRCFGVRGHARQGDVNRAALPTRRTGLLAAYLANELAPDARRALRDRLLEAAGHGATVLVVEPIARRLAPWWPEWERAFVARGGRSDEWRLAPDLPEITRRLGRAAGLSTDDVTARSLWLPGVERNG